MNPAIIQISAVFAAAAALSACSTASSRRTLAQDAPTGSSWVERYQRRTFPSVFAPWVSAQNMNLSPEGPVSPLSASEKSIATWCRHDVIWHGPGGFHLNFNHAYAGLADGFTEESIPAGLKMRSEIQACNPNAVFAMEIRYRDAPDGYLPPDSPWWKRDAQGNRIVGWKEGGYYLLDFANVDLQKQVAAQCLAAVRSGVVDGCFFDWWSKENPDKLALIQKVRAAIGEDALILVNANGKQPLQSAQYINGMYMEGLGASFFNGWKPAAENLLWARTALRKPAITALEGWHPSADSTPAGSGPASLGRSDVRTMRMLTTLSLVFSDGSILFGDPNPLPTPDHLHDWYPFWDRSLGKPVGDPGQKRADGSYWRRYEKGVVVFNPPENDAITLEFDEDRTSQATHVRARRHSVAPGDGDLFLE